MTYTCARTRDPIVKSGVRHKSLLIEFLQVSESEGKVSAEKSWRTAPRS